MTPDLSLIQPNSSTGIMHQLKHDLEKCNDELDRCIEVLERELAHLKRLYQGREDAFQLANKAIRVVEDNWKTSEREYSLKCAKNNLSPKSVPTLEELEYMKRLNLVMINFMLHHGHYASGSRGARYHFRPLSDSPHYNKLFFNDPEMAKHVERLGGTQRPDPKAWAQALGYEYKNNQWEFNT